MLGVDFTAGAQALFGMAGLMGSPTRNAVRLKPLGDVRRYGIHRRKVSVGAHKCSMQSRAIMLTRHRARNHNESNRVESGACSTSCAMIRASG